MKFTYEAIIKKAPTRNHVYFLDIGVPLDRTIMAIVRSVGDLVVKLVMDLLIILFQGSVTRDLDIATQPAVRSGRSLHMWLVATIDAALISERYLGYAEYALSTIHRRQIGGAPAG